MDNGQIVEARVGIRWEAPWGLSEEKLMVDRLVNSRFESSGHDEVAFPRVTLYTRADAVVLPPAGCQSIKHALYIVNC
jgi:hypothetical protein